MLLLFEYVAIIMSLEQLNALHLTQVKLQVHKGTKNLPKV